MLLKIRQKQNDFKKGYNKTGILAMRTFIFPVMILLLAMICSSLSYAQSGWYVQNSNTSSNLNDIFFINQSTGWAVGDSGKIVKTTNSGFSWYNQNSGTIITLTKVSFLNSTTGWAVGGQPFVPSEICSDYSVIIKTTDGGQNWATQYSSNSLLTFNDLAICNNNTVYCAAGDIGFNCMSQAGIFYGTTNSGIQWNLQGFNGNARSISFINSQTGYVTSFYSDDIPPTMNWLSKTTDGGLNWTRKTFDSTNSHTGGGTNFIRFFNENTGYFIKSNFYKTTNGGDNWTKFDSASVYGMKKFSFINQSTGYLVGANKLVKTFNAGTNFITNSGTTFTGLNSVNSVDTNHIWACGAGGKIVYGGNAIVADTASIRYFPLKVGNIWKYRTEVLFPSEVSYSEVTIISDTVINNIRYYKTYGTLPGFTGNLITMDSLTGNIFCYSNASSCQRYPQRLLIDSLAGRLQDTVYRCHNPSIGIIYDTSNYSLPWQTIKSKKIYSLFTTQENHSYGKNFGLIEYVNSDDLPITTRLIGCVINNVAYGDTTSRATRYGPYFPLSVGNTWTYKVTNTFFPDPPTFSYRKVRITGDSIINGIQYFITSSLMASFSSNLVTFDSLTGNIFCYSENSSCSSYSNRRLIDSLAARIGDSVWECSSPINGRGLDTNDINLFGQTVKSKNFNSPINFFGGVGHRYAKNFGLVNGSFSYHEISSKDELTGCIINGVLYGDTTSVFTQSISGTVKFADNNQSAGNGYVKAIKLNTSNGSIMTLDSTQIGINGTYSLTHLPPDSCDIVAYPNSEKQADFVPTYFPSTINWMNAVKVYSGNNPSNINVSVFRKTDSQGAFSINGLVASNTTNITGLPGAIVYIKQGSYFKEYHITNTTGNYNTGHLPAGDFQIVVDRLGYIGAQQNITIVSSNLDNINFSLVPTFVGIHSVSNIVPEKFSLYQNYPNPFNPVTNIKFDVPKSSMVTIKIYNVLGKEVSVLLNENKSAGSYEVDFDASLLTSGIYFYRLEAESFSATKRMVILK